MQGVPPNPEEWLRRAMEAGQNIKFGRGVVGKTGHAVLGLLGVWGVIVYRLGPDWKLDIALIGAGLIATAFTFWWIKATQRFARENPAQALLEGAQFIEYQKWESEIKGGSEVLPGSGPVYSIGSESE